MYRGQEEWCGLIFALVPLKKAFRIHYFGGGIGSKGSNQYAKQKTGQGQAGIEVL